MLEVNLLKKVRIAIGVNDDFVQDAIDGIIAGARQRADRRRQNIRTANGTMHSYPHRRNRLGSNRLMERSIER
jgi:hypothetical protein